MVKRFARKFLSLAFVVSGVASAQSVPPGLTPVDGTSRPLSHTAQSAPVRKDIPSIFKAANGAIVTIVTMANDKPILVGTGFLVSPDGLVVTNYHVIKPGNVAVVKFSDGTVVSVDGVLASDKVRDLAIIKIHGKTFQSLTLGNSDRVQIGERVVAIGNPLGYLEQTVSEGILSGIRTDEKEGGKFLQVTAAISHGSSGGPLFNMAGEVIGITSGFIEGGQNLNLAIPVNDAKFLLQKQSAKLQNLPNEPEEVEAKPAAPPVAPKVATSTERVYTADLFGGRYSIRVSDDEMRIVTLRDADWFDESVKDTLLKTEFSWSHNVVLFEKDGSYWYHELTFGFNRPNKKNGDFVLPCYFHATMGLHVESDSRITGLIGVPADVNLASCVASRTVTVPITFTSKEAHATLATPQNTPNRPLPPNTKIAASGPDPTHATPAQILEDAKYCYQNPNNNLQDSDGNIVSCRDINAGIQEQVTRCNSGPESRTEACKNLLVFFAQFKAGLL
jgi:hypothetical protein